MSGLIESGQYAALPNGTRLHFASSGKKGAPLLLFVHGFPEAWFEWEEQLSAFADTHYCVAPDLRGFNLSSKPAAISAYKPKLIVEDLQQLVAYLGYDKAIVVAHDWGGAISWNLAIFDPHLVKMLIIINSPHPYLFMRDLTSNPAQQTASQYMNWLRKEGSEEALAADDFRLIDGFFGGRGQPTPSWYTDALRARYHAMWATPGEAGSHSMTGAVNYYRASPLYPPTASDAGAAKLSMTAAQWTLRVPVRMIWGEADIALAPNLLLGIEEVCPDLVLVRIPEGSHWVIHEQPARVNALIAGFLGEA